MAAFHDLPNSPGLAVCLIWAASVVVLAWALVAAARHARRNLPRLRQLGGEDGFAYSLSFIMTVPFLMLLIAVVVETTLLLMVQAGTFYAAYVAARSAIVWETAEPVGTNETRVRMAAVHAMAPFASGNPVHHAVLPTDVDTSTRFAYMGMYLSYCPDGPLGQVYLLYKLVYAHHAISLSYEAPTSWDSPITATVRYEHPFHWRIIGRALGHPSPWGGAVYTRTLKSTVTLQNEGPKNKDQSLGIRYDSDY